MRNLFTLCAILICTSLALPQPLSAQDAGILLGLSDQQSYRTLWIAFSADKAEVKADVQNLVVPRADGFWTARITSWCEKDADSVPDLRDPVTYTSHQALALSSLANPRPAPRHPGKPGECKDDQVLVCLNESLTINGLFPEYVSLQDGIETSCGAHPDGSVDYWLSRLDDPKHQALETAQMFGPSGLPAFQDEVQRGKDDRCDFDPTFDPTNWQLIHRQGQWAVNGWAVTHRLCGYGYDLFPHLAPPSEVVGRQPAPLAWSKITATVADALDAVLSPDGRFLLVLGKTGLHAFRRDGAQLKPLPLDVPAGDTSASSPGAEAVVMAEWSEGRYVSRWSETLQQYLRQGSLKSAK